VRAAASSQAGVRGINPSRPRVDGVCMARSLLPLCLLATALATGPSGAEIYRCDEANGSVLFVDSPHACPNARPHEPEGRVQRVPASDRPRSRGDGNTPPARIAPIAAPGIAPEDVLLARADLSAEWDIVEEMPEDPARDPDLMAWGVRATRARHYTRISGADGSFRTQLFGDAFAPLAAAQPLT